MVYVPAIGLEDWQKRLGDPETHWKDGYSAKLTAQSWHDCSGFPVSIAAAFGSGGTSLGVLSPLLIFPEHQVDIPPTGARPTQADVWVLASHQSGLASIAVEGKKEESFGPTLGEWLSDASKGKLERLAFLTQLLGLPSNLPDTLRYQFLHRSASAIVEAQRFRANVAVLLIQSFSAIDTGFSDYEQFASLFGQSVKPNNPVLLKQLDGVSFYSVWVRDA